MGGLNIRQKTRLFRPLAVGPAFSAETGVAVTSEAFLPRREVLTLSGLSVAVTAANDYGSELLVTLPDTNIVLLGAVVDLVATGSAEVADITTVDVALGTAATASTDFSNAGEDDIVEAIDVAAQGVTQGDSLDNGTPGLLFLGAAADNEIHLNVAVALGSDGSVSFAGTIDILYLDLGVAG